MRNPDLWMDAETLALFGRLRDIAQPKGDGRRIFVTRALQPKGDGSGGRIMLNEPEVRELLAGLGFEVVASEALSVADQIATFAQASAVVAASGSGLYNLAFCRPGTKVIDIESEPFWGRGHIRWLDSAGLNYGVFEGTPTRDFAIPHQPYTVDIARLKNRLNSFF